MAVDKKSDYVGNHGGGYIGMDGNVKQFTYIDHDPKTKNLTGKGKYVEKKIERTELELLAEKIVHSGTNANKEFMAGYDEMEKQYSRERFNRRIPVTFVQLVNPPKDHAEEYFKKLKELYEYICKTIEEGQGSNDS